MDGSSTPPPLASYTEEILETLTPWLESEENGLPIDAVTRRLRAADFESATIKTAINQLLNRGYLYEVNGRLRLTDD